MSITSRAPVRKDTREMAMGTPTAVPVLSIVRPVSMQGALSMLVVTKSLTWSIYINVKGKLSFQPAIYYLSFRWVDIIYYMHGQLILWTDWLRIQKHIPTITFFSIPDISSSALQASSLAFLMQSNYFGFLTGYMFIICGTDEFESLEIKIAVCVCNILNHLSLR